MKLTDVRLLVEDVPRSVAFYRDVVGVWIDESFSCWKGPPFGAKGPEVEDDDDGDQYVRTTTAATAVLHVHLDAHRMAQPKSMPR